MKHVKQTNARQLCCVALCLVSVTGVLLAGCKPGANVSEEQKKKDWAGSAPPPGFEKEMARQNREWAERDAKARAKLGKPSVAPEGAKL